MSRKFIKVSIILLLLMVLPLIAWRVYLAHTINGQLAEIRSAGLPVNGEQLNRWYTAVPENQNAGLALTKAFELRSNFSDIRSNLIFDFKLPERRAPLSASQIQLLKDYVALNEPMLHKIDEALKLPGCRYPVDFTKLGNTPLPHLAWLKRACLTYQYEALLALNSGETKTADASITKILALARTLNREPCLISQLVRAGLIKIAFTTLELRANAGAFSSTEAADLNAAFTQSSVSDLSVCGFIGERAMTIPYFQMTRQQALQIGIHESADDPTKGGPPMPFNGSPVLRWIGYYDTDYRAYLIGIKRAISLASYFPPENLRANGFLAHAGSAEIARHHWVSGQRFSAYAGVVTRENAGIAYQRLALTALAVECFRTQTGHLPESLDQLTPQFLDGVWADPFDGRIRYKTKNHGYVIYSVGPDLLDNGGLEECDKKSSADGKSYDITFTIDR